MDDHLLDTKTALRTYLQEAREAVVWKLDGLGGRDLRLPRTPTGTHLLGLVRHCASVEIGYFGPTCQRRSAGRLVGAHVDLRVRGRRPLPRRLGLR